MGGSEENRVRPAHDDLKSEDRVLGDCLPIQLTQAITSNRPLSCKELFCTGKIGWARPLECTGITKNATNSDAVWWGDTGQTLGTVVSTGGQVFAPLINSKWGSNQVAA